MEGTTFEINGEQFDVVKRGISQARQVADLGKWLSAHGAPAFRSLSERDDIGTMGGAEFLLTVFSALTPEALVELFSLVFGCTYELASEQFDVALLLDGIISLYTNQPSVERLISRFFSGTTSRSTTDDSSTKSEEPMDGQTK